MMTDGTNQKRPDPVAVNRNTVGLEPEQPTNTVRSSATHHNHKTHVVANTTLSKTMSMSMSMEKKSGLETANRPHPSLEYPPLYFLLKGWPWLFENIKPVYVMRWKMSYPLQKKVPFSRLFRKFRVHLTWGELVLVVPFLAGLLIAILGTVVKPSVSVTGHVSRTALILTLVLAQRNSLVTLLFGMPVDRTLFYHKISAYMAYTTGIMHACAFFLDPKMPTYRGWGKLHAWCDTKVNVSGTVMLGLMTVMIITSLPVVRRLMFQVFYYVHIACVVGMVLGALYHTGFLVPLLAAATWGADLFIRKVVMASWRYPRQATIKHISDTVIEVSFPKQKGFDYNPGQYVYICFPEIAWFEWHPFSISSSPKHGTVVCVVLGSITYQPSVSPNVCLSFSDTAYSQGGGLDFRFIQAGPQAVGSHDLHRRTIRKPGS